MKAAGPLTCFFTDKIQQGWPDICNFLCVCVCVCVCVLPDYITDDYMSCWSFSFSYCLWGNKWPCWGTPLRTEGVLQLRATEVDSVSIMNDLGSRFYSRWTSNVTTALANTHESLSKAPSYTVSGLLIHRNCGIISVCCLKQLSLWKTFVVW